uniref:Uncharacterized protein n=1 Tax=Panagrolaimus davidi TaxID=227884 RepID=A0A914RD09_9BILA
MKVINPTYIGPLEEVIIIDPRRQLSEVRYTPPKAPAYVEIKSHFGDGSGSENASVLMQTSSLSQNQDHSTTEGHSKSATPDLTSESTDKDGTPGKSDEERYTAWDQGAPDYQGRDAFSFIKKQIESVLHESLPQAVQDPIKPEEPLPSPEPEIKNVITENVVPETAGIHEGLPPTLQEHLSSETSSEQQQQQSEQQHQQE